MRELIPAIGALINLFGCLAYLRAVFKDGVKPNRITWFLWSAAPLIGSAAAFSKGYFWSVLPVFSCGFGPLLVLIGSFLAKNGYWKLGLFDYVCGALSALALILWGMTKEPDLAVLLSILSDLGAMIPTLSKAYRYPQTEASISYWTGALAALTGFLAVKSFTFTETAYLVYLTVANLGVVIALALGKRGKRRKNCI